MSLLPHYITRQQRLVPAIVVTGGYHFKDQIRDYVTLPGADTVKLILMQFLSLPMASCNLVRIHEF